MTALVIALAVWLSAPGTAQTPPPAPLDFETYRSRVEPVFLKKRQGLARCFICHARSTAFRLQPLTPGATSWTVDESRKNFEAAQKFVAPGDPKSSRLLLMPLAKEAGGIAFHPGGKHWTTPNDPEFQAIAAWVNSAKP